jgi:hypothetical protein
MYKTPSNFHIGMRGGASDLCSPLEISSTWVRNFTSVNFDVIGLVIRPVPVLRLGTQSAK